MKANQVFLGIDVSKDSFEIALVVLYLLVIIKNPEVSY